MQYILLVLLIVFNLVGCSSTVESVPVTEAWHQKLTSPMDYIVQPGDTIYSIAWNYGLDYRAIAIANKISAPYHIHAGQALFLDPRARKIAASTKGQKAVISTLTKQPQTKKPGLSSAIVEENIEQELEQEEVTPAATHVLASKTNTMAGIAWAWPAHGQILNCFCACGLNKGIDIGSGFGTPIVAAAAGKIVYAGNGLRGYGELIIIKHDDEFLSAYAHNQKLLVREGQTVRVGQMIALMGNTEANCVMVHFEIRKAGKPVNPLIYLPRH